MRLATRIGQIQVIARALFGAVNHQAQGKYGLDRRSHPLSMLRRRKSFQ
jgi:hypothetical protein